MKNLLITAGLLLLGNQLGAQTAKVDVDAGDWGTLGMVTFADKFDENLGYTVQIPEVSLIAMAKQGKEVELTGYMIPLTGKTAQSHFMLSRYPQNMCFFCGKAGPETAAQVFMKDEKKAAFKNDKITVKGTLIINATDINNLLYTIQNAQILD